MDFALKSDIGKLRKLNEDYCGCYFKDDNNLSLFVLADGMGGHNAGEIASKITVESILAKFSEFIELNSKNVIDNKIADSKVIDKKIIKKKITDKNIKNLITDSISHANSSVVSLAKHNSAMEGMGTTVVMAAIWGNKAYISHVGDSRAYLISDKCIKQLTVDHSYIEELIQNGTITRESAKTHPDRNVITRAIGVEEDVEIDTDVIKIEVSDAIILCSDGLTNLIEKDEILDIYLKGSCADDICAKLLKEANQRGGYDNITAIVIIKTK